MKDKYLINNPDFAYKLFSTMGIGRAVMSDYEEKLCSEIWDECNHVRSDVFIKCVQICGNVNTPLARYVRAKAWSWNIVCYSNNAIIAIIDYLNHDLYEDSFKDNIIFDNYNTRKNHHLFNMYLDLGKAYEGAKKYDEAIDVYNESKKFVCSQVPYIKIANRYKSMKEYDKALMELEEARKSKYAKYPTESDFGKDYIDLRVIDSYYKKIKNSKLGIVNHEFLGYDRIEALNNIDYYNNLKNKYKDLFEERRKVLEYKDLAKIELKKNESEKNIIKFINVCMKDIEIALKTKGFYVEINKFTNNFYEINDNGRSGISSIKDLVVLYKKKKNYHEAIKICQLAIDNGFRVYSKDKTYSMLKDELMKKI